MDLQHKGANVRKILEGRSSVSLELSDLHKEIKADGSGSYKLKG